MSVQEQTKLYFDILSYPRRAEMAATIIDVDGQVDYVKHPSILHAGRRAVALSAEEAATVYSQMADDHGFFIDNAMLITDRPEVAETALESGMGVVQVDDANAAQIPLGLLFDPTSQTDEKLYERDLFSELTLDEVAEALYRPGEITTVGFVGPTGAGKSTTIRRLLDRMPNVDGKAGLFEVDAFFKLSRADRKAWLNEPGISDAERTDRQRVITWWDLGRATDTLERIRGGEHIYMEGLYDMRQGGEMVGVLDIDPGDQGYTVFVEGTALLAPEFKGVVDTMVYLNTHDQVRAANLLKRNRSDGYTDEESRVRKALTDKAETSEHLSKQVRQARFTDGGLIVLDNSKRTKNTLRLMPPYIPRR